MIHISCIYTKCITSFFFCLCSEGSTFRTIFYEIYIYIMIQVPSDQNKLMRFGYIKAKRSCFFEHEEIKTPLQLPGILGLLKAQK